MIISERDNTVEEDARVKRAFERYMDNTGYTVQRLRSGDLLKDYEKDEQRNVTGEGELSWVKPKHGLPYNANADWAKPDLLFMYQM